MFEVLRIRWEVAEEIMGPYLSLRVPTLVLASYLSDREKSPVLFVSLFACLDDGKAGSSAPLLALILLW